MSQQVLVQFEMPSDMERFTLPEGVKSRLEELLDRQDATGRLSDSERREAEGLVNLTELLSLLKLRAQRVWHEGSAS